MTVFPQGVIFYRGCPGHRSGICTYKLRVKVPSLDELWREVRIKKDKATIFIFHMGLK